VTCSLFVEQGLEFSQVSSINLCFWAGVWLSTGGRLPSCSYRTYRCLNSSNTRVTSDKAPANPLTVAGFPLTFRPSSAIFDILPSMAKKKRLRHAPFSATTTLKRSWMWTNRSICPKHIRSSLLEWLCYGDARSLLKHPKC
jgi:hypothetical protein